MKPREPAPEPPAKPAPAYEDVPCPAISPLEVARFIESMTIDLRTMARNAKLGSLTFFLDMVHSEACAEVERLTPQGGGHR